VLESIAAGEIVEVPGPHTTIMAGLNAGLPSLVAWPAMRDGFDVFCAVSDDVAVAGMRRLAALGLAAGEVSGGTAGATAALLADRDTRAALAADDRSTVLLVLTEGVTDPAGYARAVG
jgi:diaminopropionate ammonia-lyase